MLSKRKKIEANDIPTALIQKISYYLDYSDAYKFAGASKYLFFSLDPVKVLSKRPDYLSFSNSKIEKLENVIKLAIQGIENYLNEDAEKPKTAGDTGWYTGSVSYSKGYRRAICFKDILENRNNNIINRVFALYVLLRESNGKKLKSKVNHQLGTDFFNMIESYIQYQFSSDKIHKMEETLLNSIHDNRGGPLPDRNDYYLKENVEVGFTKIYLDLAIESVREKKAACVVS